MNILRHNCYQGNEMFFFLFFSPLSPFIRIFLSVAQYPKCGRCGVVAIFIQMILLLLLLCSHHPKWFLCLSTSNMMILPEMKIKFADSFLPSYFSSMVRFGLAYLGLFGSVLYICEFGWSSQSAVFFSLPSLHGCTVESWNRCPFRAGRLIA